MTCAKTTVSVTLVAVSGRHFTGTNWCRNPQPVCPRLPGEDYAKCKTVCDQVGHAEVDALRLAGSEAKGATAYLQGHTYFCMPCQHALFGAGVVALRVGAPPRAPAESAHLEIADQMGWVPESPEQRHGTHDGRPKGTSASKGEMNKTRAD